MPTCSPQNYSRKTLLILKHICIFYSSNKNKTNINICFQNIFFVEGTSVTNNLLTTIDKNSYNFVVFVLYPCAN